MITLLLKYEGTVDNAFKDHIGSEAATMQITPVVQELKLFVKYPGMIGL